MQPTPTAPAPCSRKPSTWRNSGVGGSPTRTRSEGWRHPETKRQRILSADEALALGGALRQAIAEGRVERQWFGFILLTALHGTRKSELLKAERAWLDRSLPALRLPDSKTGERLVYLSRASLAIIDALPVRESNPYLIVGRRTGRHLANRLRRRSALRRDRSQPGEAPARS